MTRSERANFLTGKSIMQLATSVSKTNESASTDDYSAKALKEKIEKGEADFAAGRGRTFTIEQLEAMMHESA